MKTDMKSISRKIPVLLLLLTLCVSFTAPATQAVGRYAVDELTGMGESASADVSGGIRTYAGGVQSRVYNEGAGYLYDYVLRTTGQDTLTRENWLDHLLSHADDDYYLGTVFPYGGGARGYSDYRNPNGHVSTLDEQWGTDNYAYRAGMNCTGFVWSALWNVSGLDYETAFDVLPCMGAYKYNSDPNGYRGMGNWKWFLNGGSDTAGAGDQNVEYKTYWLSCSAGDDPDVVFDQLLDAVFEDGYAEIGDIIYTWDGDNGTFNEGTGTDTQALGNDHIGILSCNYFESGGQDTSMTERTWWNSMPERAGHAYAPYENVLGPISPCSNYCCVLTVVKIQAPAGGDVVYETYDGETAWWYEVDGVVQTGYTGVADYANEYGWWYIENGRVDFSFNGFAENQYGWWYVENGQVTFAQNSVIQGTVNSADGWYEVIGGRVRLDHTGVTNVCNEYGWWYVRDGKVDFSQNSVEPNDFGWWYVLGGQVWFNYTGVGNYGNDYGWWYISGGRVDFSKYSVEPNDYGWWYVLGGKIDFDYTGVADCANDYGWWYIRAGKVDFSQNSVEPNVYGWWYVQSGQVRFDYTGVADYANAYGWWYIKNGQVDFSCNSVELNSYGWWYVAGGKVDFSYTGLASNAYGTWYLAGGRVDFGFSGTYGGRTIRNGQAV